MCTFLLTSSSSEYFPVSRYQFCGSMDSPCCVGIQVEYVLGRNLEPLSEYTEAPAKPSSDCAANTKAATSATLSDSSVVSDNYQPTTRSTCATLGTCPSTPYYEVPLVAALKGRIKQVLVVLKSRIKRVVRRNYREGVGSIDFRVRGRPPIQSA